jgi:hypothetical protein
VSDSKVNEDRLKLGFLFLVPAASNLGGWHKFGDRYGGTFEIPLRLRMGSVVSRIRPTLKVDGVAFAVLRRIVLR